MELSGADAAVDWDHRARDLPRRVFARLELAGNDVYPYATTLAPSLVFADVDFSGA